MKDSNKKKTEKRPGKIEFSEGLTRAEKRAIKKEERIKQQVQSRCRILLGMDPGRKERSGCL